MVIQGRSASLGFCLARGEPECVVACAYPRFCALRFGPDVLRRWLLLLARPSFPKIDLRTTSGLPVPDAALAEEEEGGGLGELMRRTWGRPVDAGDDEREWSEGEGDTDRPLCVPTLMLRPVPAM